MTKAVFLDGNIYNLLDQDLETRTSVAKAIARGQIRVIATPVVVDELLQSPFGGVPDWFSVDVEVENVAVPDHWHLGQAGLGDGRVFTEHRGTSHKTRDAIIADSADALADVLVTDDRRCRKRLLEISSKCTAFDYKRFRRWLANEIPSAHETGSQPQNNRTCLP